MRHDECRDGHTVFGIGNIVRPLSAVYRTLHRLKGQRSRSQLGITQLKGTVLHVLANKWT